MPNLMISTVETGAVALLIGHKNLRKMKAEISEAHAKSYALFRLGILEWPIEANRRPAKNSFGSDKEEPGWHMLRRAKDANEVSDVTVQRGQRRLASESLRAAQAADARLAMAEYRMREIHVRERTAQLRLLRLARLESQSQQRADKSDASATTSRNACLGH